MNTNHTITRSASLKITKEFYTENMEEVFSWNDADMVVFTIEEVNENELSKAFEKLEKKVEKWCNANGAIAEIPTREMNANGTFMVSVAATKI